MRREWMNERNELEIGWKPRNILLTESYAFGDVKVFLKLHINMIFEVEMVCRNNNMQECKEIMAGIEQE